MHTHRRNENKEWKDRKKNRDYINRENKKKK